MSAADVNPLIRLQRLVSSGVEDLRATARVLPELAETLAEISKAIDTLNAEVVRMRAGVEAIQVEVLGVQKSLHEELGAVREALVPLDANVRSMRAGVDNLGPQLDDVTRTLRPVKRVSDRLRGRDRHAADPAGDDAG